MTFALSSVVIALPSPLQRNTTPNAATTYIIRKPGAEAAAVRKPNDRTPSSSHHLTVPSGSRAELESVDHPVASQYGFRVALLVICLLVGVYAWFAVQVYRAHR